MDVTEIIFDGLTQSFGKKVCALGYSDGSAIDHGTGHILQINNHFYIITCKHVADVFFRLDTAELEIYSERVYPKADLEYISSSESLDIAVIGFRSLPNIEHYFDETDLQIIPDYGEFNFDSYATVVLGFPGDMSELVAGRRELSPLAYFTGPLETKISGSDFIYLDFPYAVGDIHVTGSITTSPRPKGMSGGPVLLIPSVNKTGVWLLSDTKLIAVQTAWDGKSYLKATNIRHVVDLIP